MPEKSKDRLKLLFVISNDFGELSTALYFAMGQPFDVILALPPRLHAIQGMHLSGAVHQYQTVENLIALADRERPNAVFLCSGYLLGINGIFTVESLRELVGKLRVRGCGICTTDPFLGLLADPEAPSLFSDAHPKKAWLTEHFKRVAETLRGLAHLYPFELDTAASHPAHSFFNEHMILTAEQRAEFAKELGNHIALRANAKRWLFVLSAEDYGLQLGRYGPKAVSELLIRRLSETLAADRQPFLVAPSACIDLMRSAAGSIEGATLLPFCQHSLFQTLLLEAEYVFFWNVFSYSVLTRVANGLPIIFFDPGHIAYAMPILFRQGLSTYYGNMKLPAFSQQQELNLLSLSKIALDQKGPFAQRVSRLRRQSTVLELLHRILES